MSYIDRAKDEGSRGKIGDYLKRIRGDEHTKHQTRTVGMPLVSSDLDEIDEDEKTPPHLGFSSNPAWMHKKY